MAPLTILKIGQVGQVSEANVFAIADHLATKLTNLQVPKFTFDSWWQWGSGNIVLHISPQDRYISIYNAAAEAAKEIMGESAPMAAFGRFIPHVALAYTKTHHDELTITKQLSQKLIQPGIFDVKKVSLVRQHPKDGHYEWEVVREIVVGQE